MKTTSRKRLLVSSVAMLLVAMLALGTATFAWFTSNTSATADQLSVQTSKSSELKVSKNDLDWQDAIHYGVANKTLKPISSADGSNWYSSVAAAKTASTSNGTYTPQTSLDNYVVVDMLNIKNAGGQVCEDVTISVTATFNSSFARLAIVPCATAQETAGAANMPSITKDEFKANIYGQAASRTWKPYNGTSVEAADYSTKGAANGASILVGDMEANAVKSYKVILWFEGEDEDCFDTTTAQLTVPAISFSVTGATA